MFSSASGFKSQFNDLTFVVVSEFNEWKVLAYGQGVTIHGTRQFTEENAKDHARSLAENYAREHGQQEASVELQWQPTSREDWLVWRG